jgi:hypothetical protein
MTGNIACCLWLVARCFGVKYQLDGCPQVNRRDRRPFRCKLLEEGMKWSYVNTLAGAFVWAPTSLRAREDNRLFLLLRLQHKASPTLCIRLSPDLRNLETILLTGSVWVEW